MSNPFTAIVDEANLARPVEPTPLAGNPTVPVNPFTQLVDESNQRRVDGMIRIAQQYDPDLYARARAIAPGNLPPGFVINHIDEQDRDAVRRGYMEFFASDPRMAAWATSNVEMLRTLKLDELKTISETGGFFGAAGLALNRGEMQRELTNLGVRAVAGTATAQDLVEIQRLQTALEDAPVYESWLAQGFTGLLEQLPSMAQTALAGVKGAIAGGTLAAGAGFLAGGPVGAATAFTVGAAAGGVAGAGQDIYLQSAGAAYLDFASFRDENGDPLAPEAARLAALMVAAPVTLLDTVGLGVILRNVPGFENLTSGIFKTQLQRALRDPNIRAAFTNFARETGIGVGTEVTTEVLQEVLQMAAGEIAKASSGQQFEMATGEDWQQRITDTFSQMASIMTILGPVVNSPMFIRDLRAARQSTVINERIREVATALQGNPALERDPVAAAAAINVATLNAPVYLQEDELTEFYQEAGLDINAVTVPGWAEMLANARAGDGIIQMTLGDFIAHLAKDPESNPLLDMVRGTPDGFAPGEIRTFADQYMTLLRGEPPQQTEGAPGVSAAPVEPPPLSPQALNIQGAFENSGIETAAAENYARLLDSFVSTMSERIGMKPLDLWDRIGLQVVRASGSTADMEALLQTAWHGTFMKGITEFKTEFLGTGEGAQAFGWGMYFAGDPDVARNYQETISRRRTPARVDIENQDGTVVRSFTKDEAPTTYDYLVNEKPGPNALAELDEKIAGIEQKVNNLREQRDEIARVAREEGPLTKLSTVYGRLPLLDRMNFNDLSIPVDTALHRYEAEIAHYEKRLATGFPQQRKILEEIQGKKVFLRRNTGAFYEVDVPENDVLLDWDAYEFQQPDKVKAVMEKLAEQHDLEFETGSEFYYALANALEEEFTYRWKAEFAKGKKNFEFNGKTYTMSGEYNREQLASELLVSKGILGHRFLDGNSRKKGRGNYNYVVYSDAGVKVIAEFMQDARGSIKFYPDKTLISLFEKADLSTALHEFGHLFFQTFVDLAKNNPALAKDLDLLRVQFGFTDFKLDRKAHEKFARAFENYLMRGEAPSLELQGIFNRFRAWLLAIYMKVKGQLPRVTPEMKEVFDRMLASEKQIEAKGALKEYSLKSAKELGFDPETYAIYAGHVQALRNQAQNTLHRSYVGDAIRWTEGWAAKVLTEIKKEIEGKILADPNSVYSKLGIVDRALKNEPDADPETLALFAGFASAKELEDTRASVPSFADTVEELARDEMRKRHGMGDLDKADTLEALALSAMHTDARTTVLGEELKALWRRGGKEAPVHAVQLARNVARATIAKEKIGFILSGHKFLAGYQKAARASDRALLKGKFEQAAEFKRQQLVRQEMIREANEVRKKVEKARKQALRFSNPKRIPKEVDPAYAAQITALAAQFDFTSDAKRLPSLTPLKVFVDKATAEGDVLEIDPALFSGKKIPFPQLTLEELEGVVAALDSLEHAGRRANEVRVAGELKAKEEEFLRVLKSLGKHKPRKRFQNPKKVWQFLNNGNAAMTKAESLIKMLDFEDVGGPLTELVMRPLQEAQAAVNTEMVRVLKPLIEKIEGLGIKHLSQKVEIPSLKGKNGEPHFKSRNEMIMIALVGGTDAGYKRLRQTGLPEQAYYEVIGKLTPAEVELANYIWGMMDEFKDKINTRMARITGVKPSQINARPFNNLRGGWVPLTEDYNSPRVVAKKNGGVYFDQDAIQAALQTQDVDTDIPLLLDLDTFKNRLHDLIYAVNMREPVAQAKKVLFEPRVHSMLEQIVGRGQTQMFDGYLKYLGKQMTSEPLTSGINRALDHMRIGTSAMSLGFNIGTGFAQILGLSGSIHEIGGRWVASGLRDVLLNPGLSLEIMRKSEFMNNRSNNIERDIQRNYEEAIAGKIGRGRRQILNFAHKFIAVMDFFVSFPTWKGAYNKQLRLTPNDEEAAVYAADRAVRLSQGSSAPVDLAYVVRQPGVFKWFTMYFTWASVLYNQTARLTERTGRAVRTGRDIPGTIAQWSVLVIIPALLNQAWNDFRFPDSDDEDQTALEEGLKTVLGYPLASMPFVRDIISAFNGYEFKQTPVSSFFQSLVRAASTTSGIIAGDPDPNWRRLYGDSVQMLGTLLHLPLRPLKNAGLDWFEQAETGEYDMLQLLRGQL